MTSTDKAKRTTTRCDNVDSTNKDEAKFQAAISIIDKPYVQLIPDILLEPPEIMQCELLKKELIKSLDEWNAKRVRKLIENEEIGESLRRLNTDTRAVCP